MRKAADHRAADSNPNPHHHIPRDAKHLVEEHQPPGEAKHERQPKTDMPIGAKTETTLSPQVEPVRGPAPSITGPIPATAANPGD